MDTTTAAVALAALACLVLAAVLVALWVCVAPAVRAAIEAKGDASPPVAPPPLDALFIPTAVLAPPPPLAPPPLALFAPAGGHAHIAAAAQPAPAGDGIIFTPTGATGAPTICFITGMPVTACDCPVCVGK